MIPVDKVREIIKKHEILEKELSSGVIEKKLFASKSKEYSELNAVISHAKDYLTFDKTRDDLKKIIGDENNDKEMIELAKIELSELEDEKGKNESHKIYEPKIFNLVVICGACFWFNLVLRYKTAELGFGLYRGNFS